MLSLLSILLVAAPSAMAEEVPAEPTPTFSEKYAGAKPADPTSDIRHGFRVGYVYAQGGQRAGLSSDHLFAMGWEAEFRLAGNDQIDFLIVPNVMLIGMNQGVLIPSGNLLVGASINRFFEVGVGANLTIGPAQPLHMVMAAGIAPSVGTLEVPISLSFIPDERNNFRLGLTAGVNWGVKREK